jgi:restriction system protein
LIEVAGSSVMEWIEKGKEGEATLVRQMKSHLDPSVYQIVSNVTLELIDGTTQIDVIVFSVFGIFVIENKAYQGFIYGSEKQAKWTYALNRRSKYSFQNPLFQNYRHIKALVASLGAKEETMKSVITFQEGCKFKTSMPPNVICGSPIDYIFSCREPLLNFKEINEYQTILKYLRLPESAETDAYHVKSLESRFAERQASVSKVKNPRQRRKRNLAPQPDFVPAAFQYTAGSKEGSAFSKILRSFFPTSKRC